MAQQRTGGMTAIGILNFVFGGLGCIFALLMVLGGGMVSFVGNALEEAAAEPGMSAEATAGGGQLMLFGLAGLALGVLLIVAGVGVFKVRPWGRTLSLAYAGLKIIVGAAGAFFGFGMVTAAFGFVYPIVLAIMFMKPGWKTAFSDGTATSDTTTTGDQDQFQAAA